MARPVGLVGGGRDGPGLVAVQEAVWQGVVKLGHGAVQAVQRDGWQQQQHSSGGGGGEEQEMQRSRLHAGRKAIEGELSSPRQKFYTTARGIKRGR